MSLNRKRAASVCVVKEVFCKEREESAGRNIDKACPDAFDNGGLKVAYYQDLVCLESRAPSRAVRCFAIGIVPSSSLSVCAL